MKDSPNWFTRWKTFLWLALVAALSVVAGQTRGGTCTPPPAGLVGWWKGDGNTTESVSGNSGVNQNVAYSNGIVDQAFSFDPENYPFGTYTGVQIPDQSAYALTNSLTIEGWVRPRGDGYIVFWRGDNRPGMDPYYLSMHGDSSHAIDFGITDAAGNNAFVETTLNYFTWIHLAATLDGDSGTLSIYTNGVLAAQTNTTVRPFGNLIPEDSPGVSIGNLNDGGNNFPFYGDVDEISLYSRALSPGEIQAIYNAGNAGKCTTNESTNNCVTSPSDLAGWWPAEGNANDVVNGNNGILVGGASFASGKVGLGFRLDGTNSYVQIPDSAALKPTNVTCEAWVWLDPSLPSNNGGEQIVFKKNTWTAWFEGYSLLKATIDNGNGTYVDRFQFCVSRYGNQVAINSQTTAQRGVWYHVAGTYDGNQSKLYVNGVLEASATPGFPLDYDTTPIFIGTSGTWAPYLSMFGGIIDEASIYSRALSSNEIQAIYNAGSAGKCTPNESTNNCVTPPSDLAAWWPGEGNANDIVGTNNGSLIGTVTFTNGEVGQGFYFDGGANGIVVQDAPELNFSSNQDLSIDAWIQPLAQPGNDYDIIDVLDKRVAPAINVQLGYDLFLEAGVLSFQMADVLAVNSFNNFSAGPDLRDGNFHHVAVTVQRNSTSGGRFYIDGQLAGTFDPTVCQGDLSNAGSLLIGDHPTPGFQASYHGIIDELSLYRRALTSNEISAIYNAGSAGKCTSSYQAANFLLNVDFGVGNGRGYSLKTGVAAVGLATNDFWNYYDRNASSDPYDWRYSGALQNLQTADGLTTSAGMSVSDAPGGYGTSSGDPMYAIYDYPLDGGNNVVTFTNLLSGNYDVLAYSADGNYEITVGTTSYGVKTTYDPSPTGVPVWMEGVQYARWNDVSVAAGQTLALTVRNGTGGYAILSGIQLLSSQQSGVPVISGFSPAVGANNTVVTISGNHFGSFPSDNIVYFGAVRAEVLAASPTSLTTTVPAGATYAPITVTVNGLTAYSSQPFMPTFGGAGQAISSASFGPNQNLAAGDGPTKVVIADLHGDGKPDLVVANTYDHTIWIYKNISSNGALTAASFATPVILSTPAGSQSPYYVEVADLDGDGKLDIIASDYGDNLISVYRNVSTTGGLTTNSFAARLDFATGATPIGITVRDLDGDGKPEIVTANAGDATISIFQNLSTLGNIVLAPKVDLAVNGGAQGVAIGDLDGDGKPDVAVAEADGFISLFRNNGTPGNISSNSFGARVDLPAASGSICVVIGDLDGDGKPELITTSYLPLTMSVYRNLATLSSLASDSFAAPVDYALAGRGHSIALADVNGDGKPDIAEVTELNSALSMFQNIGAGGFTNTSLASRVDFTTGYNAWGVAVGDLDGDGRPDVVFANAYDKTVTIYQNQMLFGTVPIITGQPTNQDVAVGESVTFTVAAQGAIPLSYQWTFNNTNLPGATNDFLTLANVQPEQAGNYAVLVSNPVGSAASSNAVLTIYVPAIPPAIVSQTPNQVVLLGHTETFDVTASGSDPLSYFWLRNDVLIPGATNASYSLPNAQLADSGSQFYCLVTNAYGVASSTNVTLKVIDTIANDLCSGAIVISNGSYTNVQSTLKASSFGDPVPDCVDGFGHGVWYQFTAPVDGRLIVDTLGSDFDTGLAIYTGSRDALTEVACNDDFGGVTSQVNFPTTAGTTYFILVGGYDSDAGNLVLHLNYQTPPAFAMQPVDESIIVNSNASFNAIVTGALPMSFQWYFGATPLTDDGRISGSTTASLSISNITTADAGSYSLAVTNFLGSTNSVTVVLTVLVPPSISLNPVGRSVPPGLPTTFNATATGNPAPVFQWQLNDTNIPGATGSSYAIAAVGTNDLGLYHLVASNLVGVATSVGAQLTFGSVAAWGRNLDNECLPPPGLSNVIAVAGNFGASFAVRTDGAIVPWGVQINIPSIASNVVAITTSDPSQNYALRSDGTVVGWPVIAAPVLSNIVSIAAGYDFAYALRAEGTLTNIYLGKNVRFPAGLNHVTAIACGYSSAMALRSDGTVVIAGLDSITNPPAGLNNVTAIAAGYSYAMTLKTNGTVVAWGSGSGTNLPAGMTNIVAISAGNYPSENSGLAIRADGSVLAWGDNNFGEKFPPSALSNLASVAVSAPTYHGLALVNDGSPVILHPPIGFTAYTGRDVMLRGDAAGAQPLSYQWLYNGVNISGATNNILAISNVQSGDAGNYQLFVSNSIGTTLSLAAPLAVVSNSILTFLSQPPTLQTNYQGSKTTLGVTVLGSGPVNYQWSYSTNIQAFFTTIPGATNDNLVFDPALASQSGYYRLVASNKFSTVTSSSTYLRVLFAKPWGYLAKDPPFDVTNAIAIAAGNSQSGGHYLALKSDGKISSWSGSFSQYSETNVSALSNSFVTAIAAGYQDSLALKSDGALYAWGFGVYGETNVPLGLSGVTAIACGDYHDLALKSDGTVAGWGQNNSQQTTNAAATNVVAIAAGGLASMALRADGSVVTWGSYGTQPPFFVNTTNNIAIAAGAGHFLALRTNGTVIGWGNNSYGQTTIPAGISNIVAISAGANHSVLLRNDGSVITLGAYAGQTTLGAPTDLANVVAIASSGDHDLALFGTRAPVFTVQPWNRSVPYLTTGVTNIVLTGKCSGVQPVSYQWQLNGTNYPGATNDSLTLRGDPPSRILVGAYRLIASNAYGVAASKFAKVTTFYPLADALDTVISNKDRSVSSFYNWTTSGNAQWFGETNIAHDGVDAAQSGGIGALQESILQTTVGTNWSGTYTFWWKVSSEEDFDYLEFRVNGITQASISGLSDWQQASIHVDAYTNVLQWRYSKDASFDFGLDAGWVDQFAFVPDPPKITMQPVSQTVNMGANVKLMVTATGPNSLLVGGPVGSTLRYQWRQNGQNIGGGSSLAFLTLNNVGRAKDGTYSVIVTNFSLPNNSIVSSNAVLKVLVPQLLGSPVLLPDGSFQLTSTDANGGLLSPSDLANFEAQASSNLVDWVTLPNALSLTNGMLLLQDGGQSNYATRFYRLLEH